MECVCKHEMTRHDWKNQWVCHRCGRTKLIKQTQTNADRIRAMSDEELACYIALVENRKSGVTVFEDTSDKWLKWLKQPAEEE